MKNQTNPQPGAPAQAPHRREPNPPARILVVDGDSDLCLLYSFVLAGPNRCVDFAQDGAAGWQALRANNYSLLITEHEVPKLTGVGLVRKLRAARMALPVVMAAARMPADELARNPSLQLAATLLKPFSVDELLQTVSRVLYPAGHLSERTEPLPVWLHQHQPLFRSPDAPQPRLSIPLAIDYPETVVGWVKKLSHRGNPQ